MAHDFPNHPSGSSSPRTRRNRLAASPERVTRSTISAVASRSEEHTSELQSQSNLVCRLLLEKKKQLFPPPTELNQEYGSDKRRRIDKTVHRGKIRNIIDVTDWVSEVDGPLLRFLVQDRLVLV